MREQADVPFAALTTLRVGGPAKRLLVAESDDDVVAVVRQADRADRPVLVIGDGSNLLVGAEGFDGDVVKISSSGITVGDHRDDHVVLDVAAGTSWDGVVADSVDRGWGGLETLSGIPGRAGATPVQNVGAYGHEIADVLRSVRVLDRRSGVVRHLPPDACGFGYRTSWFKTHAQQLVVLGVQLRLTIDGLSTPTRYVELAEALGVEPERRCPVADVREAVLELRRNKAMVLDPGDHDTWSAGSFFTNPMLDAAAAAALPADAPRFRQLDGRVKTSAAWLIQRAGFERGYPGAAAPARLSTRHVLALTNRGSATAADLLQLAREVRDGVRREFAIELEPEPTLVGCSL